MRRFMYNMLFLYNIFIVKTLWTAAWRQVPLPAPGAGLGDFPMRREKARRVSPVHGPVPRLGRGGGGGSCGQLSRAALRKGRRDRAGKQRTHRGGPRRADRDGGPAGIRPGPACSLAGSWRYRHAGAACGCPLARGAQGGLLAVDACGPRHAGAGKSLRRLCAGCSRRRLRPAGRRKPPRRRGLRIFVRQGRAPGRTTPARGAGARRSSFPCRHCLSGSADRPWSRP